jgi:hypothetical protein
MLASAEYLVVTQELESGSLSVSFSAPLANSEPFRAFTDDDEGAMDQT